MKKELEKKAEAELQVKACDQEVDLEIIEIEEKIAPRNWNIYAIL